MPDYNWDYTENPCAALLTTKDRMRAIANVADVLFEPSLTSPKYTGTFADGQRITFDPNTVDWEQLERTCRYWSRKFVTSELGKAIGDRTVSQNWLKKMQLSSEYGKFGV